MAAFNQVLWNIELTRSPAQETARLLAIQNVLEAADLAQQAKDWALVTQLVKIAFAALDGAAEAHNITPSRAPHV